MTASLLTLPKLGIELEGVDSWIKDWRTLLLSDRSPSQRSDIAIVLVNEESVADYPYRSPVDRALLAELVRAIDAANPAAIGLDFIIDRPSFPDRDASLLEAVRAARAPIVLGSIDKRLDFIDDAAIAYQEDFFSKAGHHVGHLFFSGPDNSLIFNDEVIRYRSTTSHFPPPRKSFAEVLSSLENQTVADENRQIDWLKEPSDGTSEVFLTLRVPRHEPVAGQGFASNALPESWRSALTGKIVLIGGAFVDRDRHLTPLSIYSRARVPGVLIHAQILAQLRDGRVIQDLRGWSLGAAFALLSGLGFLLAWRYDLERYSAIIGMVGTVVLVGAGALSFALAKFALPASLLIAWLAGISGAPLARWFIAKTEALFG